MTTQIDYKPLTQAVIHIAKHYRIEFSEERVRLQLDWAQKKIEMKFCLLLLDK